MCRFDFGLTKVHILFFLGLQITICISNYREDNYFFKYMPCDLQTLELSVPTI